MREGFYRIQYETKTFRSSGVLTMCAGILSGCDPYYFMHGQYRKTDNQIVWAATYTRHTTRKNQDSWVPEEFVLNFSGICGDHFGQCDFVCSKIPIINGHATFTWMGEYIS